MPELPEVEVTRASLADRLAGQGVRRVRVGKPLRRPLGCEPSSLIGLKAGTMTRRGKVLWLPLSGPGREGGLLVHLGMSGSLSLVEAAAPPGPHDHVEIEFNRSTLRLTDPRRFGAVVWSDGLDAEPAVSMLGRLGFEPFDPALTPLVLHRALQGRRAPIKTVLMAGDIVVGAGNIYASEALFRAGIDPRTACHRIGRMRCARLLEALRLTLGRAIDVGGSTLRDFRDAHGASGRFQDEMLVYDREGHPCRRCGGTVRRIVQAQRSTYFCAGCQRR